MLEDIVAFCAIVQHKGFTKAATGLGVSVSAITRRLARLEKNLNSQLIQRTTRQISLTEAGQLFFNEVNEMLQTLESSKEKVKNLSQGVTGTIKIGMPANFCYFYLTKQLHKFLVAYPQINIHIVAGAHLADLTAHGFDIMMHCGALPDSSYYSKKLGSWQKIFCATPNYLKKRGIPKTAADLITHNCIDEIDNQEKNWDYYENGVHKKIAIHGSVRVNTKPDMVNLALNDVGIAYLPKFLILNELKSGQLTPILEHLQSPKFDSYIVYPRKKLLNKKIQLFIDFLLITLQPVYSE